MAYTRFDPEDIVLSSEVVSTPIWTNNSSSVSKNELETNDAQLGGLSSNYFIDIYSVQTGSQGKEEVQFSITYADRDGSGSVPYDPEYPGLSPSRTIYGQYRSLVLGDEESEFRFGDSESGSDAFWAISIDRARYKEKLMVGSGSFELKLTSGSTYTFVDDSVKANASVQYMDSGRFYNIRLVSSSQLSTGSYGYYLPDIGVILLDAKALSDLSGLKLNYDDIRWNSEDNPEDYQNTRNTKDVFFNMFDSLTLKSQETVTSNYVFVRAKNSQFNYSINPSNITSTGELRYDVMINSPETFITSVGLYNDSNDLLAVAKLSRPLPKNFNKEALIRIKLDY